MDSKPSKNRDVKVFASLSTELDVDTKQVTKYTTISALMNEIVNNSTGDMLTLARSGKTGLCENRAVTQLDIDLLISKNYAATVFSLPIV